MDLWGFSSGDDVREQGTRRREARAREVRVFSVSYSRSADPFDTGGTLGVRLMTPIAAGAAGYWLQNRMEESPEELGH